MKILVTGGIGFIGTNVVLDRLARGDDVRVFDNGARPGTEHNRAFLEQYVGTGRLELVDGDIRDAAAVAAAVEGADAVIHLAAQVAVTSSVVDPRTDFDVNALGTLNVVEAVRMRASEATLVYASTNKVYGELKDVPVELVDGRWQLTSLPHGVGEDAPLDFHSPYGCSKGSADQYVLDYARIYGLRTVAFRQSCIYGPFQRGNEDQGWLAHFALRLLDGAGVTIYGDGRQVRDALYVDDLVDLYDRALSEIDRIAGRAYNVGGGPGNTVSLLECLDELAAVVGRQADVTYEEWRPGDQRVFISDNRRLHADLGWEPTTPVRTGIAELVGWLQAQRATSRSSRPRASVSGG